jgi:hypothetical protein
MTTPVQITIELDDPHREPIEGRLQRSGGHPQRFVGYIELIEALQALRTKAARRRDGSQRRPG